MNEISSRKLYILIYPLILKVITLPSIRAGVVVSAIVLCDAIPGSLSGEKHYI